MEFIDLALVALFILAAGYWGYIHLSFWRTLKAEAPEAYREHSEFNALKYTSGFGWIDYALSRKYRLLENRRITAAGDRLCRAYSIFTGSFAIGVMIVCLGFVIAIVWFIAR
jgi:hypothetical protein